MDIEKLKRTTGNNAVLTNQILKKVLAQLQDCAGRVEHFLSSKDYYGGQQYTHKVKSGVGYVYNSDLDTILSGLENAFEQADTSRIGPLLNELKKVQDQLIIDIKSHLS